MVSHFENNGDQLIVHNQQGQVTQGSLTTATVPLLSSDQFQVYTYNSQTIYVATSPDFHLVSNGQNFLIPHSDGTSEIIPAGRIYELAQRPSGATPNLEAGQVYGSVEEKYLATLGTGVTTFDLLHASKSGGVFQIESIANDGTRATLATSQYTVDLANQQVNLSLWLANHNKATYQKLVITYETTAPVLDASGRPTLINGQVNVFQTLYQHEYLMNSSGQYVDANGVVTATPVAATRTYYSLTGLGLGTGLGTDGNMFSGIEYGAIENLQVRLNDTAVDNFTIAQTHPGTTTVVWAAAMTT